MAQYMGLAGADFVAAIERRIGRPLPHDFHAARAAEDARVLAEGLDPVAGAIAFVRALPPDLPRAIASSSSSAWIETHRSEERRVGTECARTCRSRWSPFP